MALLSLPTDIVILILHNIDVPELAALSRTCRLLSALVTEFGWTGYLRANPRPSYSLSQAHSHWTAKVRVRYDILADQSWSKSEFVARPLSRPWAGKMQPIIAISSSRLVVAAGSDIHSYKFGDSISEESPTVLFEGVWSLASRSGSNRDITGITFVEDGGLNLTVYVGFQDGSLELVFLSSSNNSSFTPLISSCSKRFLPEGEFIESLSSENNILLSLSSNGCASITSLNSPGLSHSVALNARSWISHLCMHSSGPYAAFGTASSNPLTVHPITNDQLSPSPSAILHTNTSIDLPPNKRSSSAVYGISRAPLASPWGASPQILVSGWFDGEVRCYDLRSSSRTSASTATNGPASLRPVLTLSDPWSFESIYSVSCGGGSSSHIAAGSARHGVVSFWDVRSPSTGWSVHAPGNDPSPVYSVVLESSRLYGATQSRPFVYDFGPGVSLETYPTLPGGRVDGLKRKKGIDVGYYVTKYTHGRSAREN